MDRRSNSMFGASEIDSPLDPKKPAHEPINSTVSEQQIKQTRKREQKRLDKEALQFSVDPPEKPFPFKQLQLDRAI